MHEFLKALDDISVTPGLCDADLTTQMPGLATATYPNLPINCNFDANFCSWENDPDADFKWERNKGATFSSLTGPLTDHTSGTVNGYYVYIEVIFISY